MIPIEIKAYCNRCNMCRPSSDFNKTPNNIYRYICKVCESDIEREKAKVLYEETKQKLNNKNIKNNSKTKKIKPIILFFTVRIKNIVTPSSIQINYVANQLRKCNIQQSRSRGN